MRPTTLLLTLLLLIFCGSSYAQITSCDGVVTNASCNGANDGAIILTVNGGTPVYTFTWTGSNGFTSTSQDIFGLSAGDYIVNVFDVTGETCASSFVISQPDAISCDDNDCSTEDTYDASICQCINTPIPLPLCNDLACDGDIEIWDFVNCECIVVQIQVLGCTDPNSCNFDSQANCDDGSCIPNTDPGFCNIECTQGDIEIWDPNSCTCVLDVVTIFGCTDSSADNFDSNANCDDGSCILNCTPDGCNQSTACNFNPNATCDDGSCIFETACNSNSCNGDIEIWDTFTCQCIFFEAQVIGCTNPLAQNYQPLANCDDGSCEINCTPDGCTDPTACNFDPNATCDDGACIPSTNPGICNEDCSMGDLEIWDSNSCTCIIDVIIVQGCTDPNSCNFDFQANCDDNSCIPNTDPGFCNTDCTMSDIEIWDPNSCTCVLDVVTILGCTNPSAVNFDSNANCDDATCILDCTPDGCTQSTACNFDPNATCDDGSCIFETACNFDPCTNGGIFIWDATTCSCTLNVETIFGCTDPNAVNFDSAANCDDGTCILDCTPDGCTDMLACNFDPTATCDDGSCIVNNCNNIISGFVYIDENSDCQNNTEQGLSGWIVRISNGSAIWHIATNSEGFYSRGFPDGTYDVNVVPVNENWEICNNSVTVQLEDDVSQDFGAVALVDCPIMEVDITVPLLIRCFSSDIYVSYCNSGTITAENATIEIELDPEMIFEFSTSLPISNVNNILTFDIGDIPVGGCGSFIVSVLLDDNCDSSVLGQTHCTTATIFPNASCIVDPLWGGASLELDASCDGNNVIFTIENVGTGNMDEPSSFIVIEDQVMAQSIPEDFILAAGETIEITKPANGSTYYMSVTQVPNHPGDSNPSLAIEGCGIDANGEISLGIVTQYSQNDNDGFVDIECVQNVGSFDPNDKRAMLDGFGEENYIYANTPMEYMIRFQNTGTFTAFNVVVEDELSPNFDITSLRPGASSHDYTFSIEDERKLVFTFENINLPDSTADLEGSNGFLTYKVDQLLDLQDGTVLENTAGIFFDFNDPVITNTTSHTIGSDFITTSTFFDNELNIENAISVYPNPSTENITFELEQTEANLSLEIFDITGKLILTKKFDQEKIILSKDGLTEGMYFYSINQNLKQLTSGKFIFL